jgi:hypothetical protein
MSSGSVANDTERVRKDAECDIDRSTAARNNARTVGKRELLPLALAVVLAILLLNFARSKVTDLNNAALGGQTKAVLAELDGQQVACFDASDTEHCEQAYKRAGGGPAVLWFGNSQNFAINRYKPGDELAVVNVHRWLKSKGAWLVSYTQPNATLYEDAVLFEALVARYDTRLVILPVFMDKLREQGIREAVAAFMNDPNSAERVKRSPEWLDVAARLIRTPETDTATVTIQEKVESDLNSKLDRYWPLWRDRELLRGNLRFAIHVLRNKAFGIHSYTKRPVDQKVYEEKFDVLARLLESAASQNVKVLLYIPPYRRDIPGPYDDVQYTKFKKDIESLAAHYQAGFADLGDTVPGAEWATVTDTLFGFKEPDFMHFTAEGHKRLAAAMEVQLHHLGFGR